MQIHARLPTCTWQLSASRSNRATWDFRCVQVGFWFFNCGYWIFCGIWPQTCLAWAQASSSPSMCHCKRRTVPSLTLGMRDPVPFPHSEFRWQSTFFALLKPLQLISQTLTRWLTMHRWCHWAHPANQKGARVPKLSPLEIWKTNEIRAASIEDFSHVPSQSFLSISPNHRQPMRWLVVGDLHPTHMGNPIWWESQTFCRASSYLGTGEQQTTLVRCPQVERWNGDKMPRSGIHTECCKYAASAQHLLEILSTQSQSGKQNGRPRQPETCSMPSSR